MVAAAMLGWPTDLPVPGRACACYRARVTEPRSTSSLRPRPALALLVGLLALPLACDKSKAGSNEPDEEGARLGYDDASSEDLAPLEPALDDHDLEGISERSMTLWKRQRALRVGERAFANKVGVTSAKFISLASVDPGASSGEVAFWRWDDKVLEDGEAAANEARRWIVVPLTFDPDTPMEAQELDAAPDAEQQRIITAVLLALSTLEKELPDARFDVHVFREQAVDNGEPTKRRQTRVYMFGSNEKSPDIELTIADPPKRGKPAEIVDRRTHLEIGQAAALPLKTAISPPGPMTLTRARATANATGKPTEIVDGEGNTWHLDPATGLLNQGPAPKSKKK